MFRHYRVILRQLVINTLPSYTSISNAAFGNIFIIKKFHVKHLNCELYYKFPEDDTIVPEHVVTGPNPGRQRIVDVAPCRRRSSNLGTRRIEDIWEFNM
jgi:hypothetical protein